MSKFFEKRLFTVQILKTFFFSKKFPTTNTMRKTKQNFWIFQQQKIAKIASSKLLKHTFDSKITF
jgi:hypothetical protein